MRKILTIFFVTSLLMPPLQASLSQLQTTENKSEDYLAKDDPVNQNIDERENTKVIFRVDSSLAKYIKEGKVKIRLTHATHSVKDARSEDVWEVHYHLLVFNLEAKHVGDIEGVILLRNTNAKAKGPKFIVLYTQHGDYLIEEHPKAPDTLYVNLERSGNAALSKDELISHAGEREHILMSVIAGAAAAVGFDKIGPLPLVTGPTDNQCELAKLMGVNWKGSTCEVEELPGVLLGHVEDFKKEAEEKGYFLSRWTSEAPKELRVEPFELMINNEFYDPFINRDFYEPYLKHVNSKTYVSVENFKQIANLEAKEPGGIDFTSVQLAYISEHSESRARGELEEQRLDCQYVFRATEAKPGDEISDLEEAKVLSLLWFLVGLSLPNHKFWVNLNPWEHERIIDEDLGRTDVGRIMLEADFQMKKDVCKYENPCESDIGEEFWSLLDRKREELVEECKSMYPGEIKSVNNVLFAAATRHWIVPDTITGYGGGDELYIANATLDIYSEPVYEHSTFEIVNQLVFVSEDCREYLSEAAKEYGRYAKEIQEEMILPLVVEEVNTDSKYSDLRQVYAALALAQWYKSHYRFGEHLFSGFIDSENLENLKSMVAWDPEEIWKEYVKSYEEGEFHCEKEYEEGGYIITRVYTAGGVEFQNIEDETSIVGSINSEIREMILETTSKPLVKRNEWYYFDDYIGISKQTLKVPSTYHSDRFSINYPKTWSVTEEGTLVTFTSPEESIRVHIKREKLDSSPTIEKYLQSRKVALARQLSNYSFIWDGVIEIDGKEGRTLVYTYASESQLDLLMKVKEVILKGEEYYWIISYTAPEGIFNTVNEEYFEEMVGSYNLMEHRTLPIGLIIEKYFVVIVIAILIVSGFVYVVVSATRKSARPEHLLHARGFSRNHEKFNSCLLPKL